MKLNNTIAAIYSLQSSEVSAAHSKHGTIEQIRMTGTYTHIYRGRGSRMNNKVDRDYTIATVAVRNGIRISSRCRPGFSRWRGVTNTRTSRNGGCCIVINGKVNDN